MMKLADRPMSCVSTKPTPTEDERITTSRQHTMSGSPRAPIQKAKMHFIVMPVLVSAESVTYMTVTKRKKPLSKYSVKTVTSFCPSLIRRLRISSVRGRPRESAQTVQTMITIEVP